MPVFTKERLRGYIDIIQHYIDGGKVQYRTLLHEGEWIETRNPLFNFTKFEYRKQRESWIGIAWDDDSLRRLVTHIKSTKIEAESVIHDWGKTCDHKVVINLEDLA